MGEPGTHTASAGGHLVGLQAPLATGSMEHQDAAKVTLNDGTVWLDAATGGFGAGHPSVTATLNEQLGRVALSSRIMLSRPLADAVRALADLCPDPLQVSYLCNSGGEALDSALKLAKGLRPSRRRVLGLAGEDHGTLNHGLGLTHGGSPLSNLALRPYTVGADRAEELVDLVDDRTAAVVIAPAAPGRPLAALDTAWWTSLRNACDRSGTLLVLDERLTGPARLGARLGTDLLGIVPDALIMGEPLGADAVPTGVMVTSRDVYDRVYARHNPTLHGSTFGANPLSSVAVLAVLRTIAEEGLVERQNRVAEVFRRELAEYLGGSGPVRAGVDGSLAWLAADDPAVLEALTDRLADHRVLVRPAAGTALGILPPLRAHEDDVARIAAAAAKAAADVTTREER